MDANYEISLRRTQAQIDRMILESGNAIKNLEAVDTRKIEKSESDLDAWDYCFCLAIGLTAPYISTDEVLQQYLTGIHDCASEANGEYDFLQKSLGLLLHHKGDPIDQFDKKFIKRDRENAYILFHRLLWGHDPFSIKEDNPFYLMIKKQGLSGIIQAVQHLLADTTSKQGLPFPGSSYFDFADENGTLSNYLIKISQDLSVDAVGSKRAAQEIYAHMFTVRAADLIGGGTIFAISEIYFMARKIKDIIRISQFRLISYSVCFWLQMLIGISGEKGLPFVNYPAGYGMLKNFVKLYVASDLETKEIVKKQKLSQKETERLERIVQNDLEEMSMGDTEEDYSDQLEKRKQNAALLAGLGKGVTKGENKT
ncbi:MAG: hypothetical protein U0L49_05850 [Eubacterium sp.]|nr:hypothetical protein [Eubacterium sp.]